MRRPALLRLVLAAAGALALAALLAGPAAARDGGQPPQPLTPSNQPPQPLTPSDQPPQPLTPSTPPAPPMPAPIEAPMAPITPSMATVKPTEPVPGPPRKTPFRRQEQFKVMSFNINSITAPTGAPGLVEYPPPWWLNNRKRDERSREIIEASGADVVVIDEAFDKGAEAMANELKQHGYPNQTPLVGESCPATGKPGGGWNGTYGDCDNYFWEKNGGTMIISKLPILEQWQYIFGEGTGWDNFANKGVALVALEAPKGGVFWVAGTHLQSSDSKPFNPYGEYEGIRREQLLEMAKFIASRANVAKETVLVAGDLNVPIYYDEMFQSGGRLLMNWGDGPTLNLFTSLKSSGGVSVDCVGNKVACDAQIYDTYADGYQDSLDYLGYFAGTDADPGVRPLDQTPPRVIDTARSEPNGYFESPSDHFPTWSKFTLGLAQEQKQGEAADDSAPQGGGSAQNGGGSSGGSNPGAKQKPDSN